jgi:hypothetical protein
MVNKYRDVVRMTFFGRHDKNLNDTSSIYQGYDRYQTTITGGGVNALTVNNSGTIGFASAPNVYLSNATNTNLLPVVSTLSALTSTINSIAVNTGGTGWTSAPTVYINGTGTGATATAAVSGGVITGLTMTNSGLGYTAAPVISFNGGGFINITAQMNGGNTIITGYTITAGGTGFTSAPSIVVSGGGNSLTYQITTCTLTGGVISSIALPTTTFGYSSAPTISIFGGGNVTTTATLGNLISSISFSNNPIGSFQTQPTISYNGGGVINITATMNGGNTSITGFNITNGGYVGCFSSAPTIVLSGASGYTTTTCTLTNGQINTITVPATNNNFVGTPTVSVYGGGLPTSVAVLNPFNVIIGGNSLYQNIKKLKFDFNQEFQTIRLANGAVMFLEFIRMPALTNISTCYKNLRVVGAQDITVFDSTQGTTGNPILFTCEGGNTAINYFLSNTEYSRLPVPPNFLNRGYIEFELDTVLTAANGGTVYTAAQLNDLIIKVVIAEPDLTQTQDNNLAPEYNKTDYQYGRVYNKQPLKK